MSAQPRGGPDLTALFGERATLGDAIGRKVWDLAEMGPRTVRGARVPVDRVRGGSVLPLDGTSPDEYVERYLTDYVARSAPVTSPRHLATMTTVVPALLPHLSALVTAMNENVVKTEASPSGSLCEGQVLAILHRLVFGLGAETYEHALASGTALGAFTTGGTLANITAMWCARNAALSSADGFADLREVGLADALRDRGVGGMCIVGPASMHYSFDKAAEVLGLGRRGLLRVPLDDAGRMDTRALAHVLRRCAAERRLVLSVVAVAGTTDAGAVDPLAEVAALSRSAGSHLHVDAAAGAALLFSRHRDLLAGIEQADTVTVDGHKQLYAPTGIGMVLFRSPGLRHAIEHAAEYAVRSTSRDLGRWSIEGSRPGSVLMLHAALHLIGTDGYRRCVEQNLAMARALAERLRRRPELELVLNPMTNVVLYRYLPPWARDRAAGTLLPSEAAAVDRANEWVHKQQRASGGAAVSRTRWPLPDAAGVSPRVVLRAVLANPLVQPCDLDEVLREQVVLGDAAPERPATRARSDETAAGVLEPT
jgi:glutamate decarboxylase